MKIFGIFFFILIFFKVSGQTWQWARQAGGDDESYGNAIVTDNSGNVYVAGSFESSNLDFGSVILPNLSSYRIEDVFLAKYNASGNLLWARRDGGKLGEYCYGIALDASNNIYLTGCFDSDTSVFGSFNLINSDSINGTSDVFLAKYDSNGNIIWAKKYGGKGQDYGQSVATDLSGNIYVTGGFQDTVTFDSTTLIGQTSMFNQSVFTVKYDSNGNVLWAKQSEVETNLTYNETVSSTCVATDSKSNVLISGSFYSDTATFSGIKLINSGNIANTSDIFIVKYNSEGNIIWAKKAGGIDDDDVTGIITDKNNNVIITGSFTSNIAYFGNFSVTNSSTEQYDHSNIFITKYDSYGKEIWVRKAGGKGYSWANGISSANNSIYITGEFTKDTMFFNSQFITDNDYSGSQKIFVAKYNSNGIVSWVQKSTGKYDQLSHSIYTFPKDSSVYITGLVYDFDTVSFGNIFLVDTNSLHEQDFFVAKISSMTLGISANNLPLSSIIIYPNPFSKETNIVANKNLIDATLSIYNPFGQEIKTIRKISGHRIKLYRGNLQSGIYYIRLTQKNFIITSKFIISK